MAKQLNARIITKHDKEENWAKATGFIPKLGEIIVYESDDLTLVSKVPRIKIGNGIDYINNLPFLTDPYIAKENGKGLSTNDYTNTAKQKVDAIPNNPQYTDTLYNAKLGIGQKGNSFFNKGVIEINALADGTSFEVITGTGPDKNNIEKNTITISNIVSETTKEEIAERVIYKLPNYIVDGDTNGTIKVAGNNVAVGGLKELAFMTLNDIQNDIGIGGSSNEVVINDETTSTTKIWYDERSNIMKYKNSFGNFEIAFPNMVIGISPSEDAGYLTIKSLSDFYDIQVGSNLTFSSGTQKGSFSVTQNGETQKIPIYGLGSNAYTSTAYLPIAGGTMTGTLYLQTTTTIAENKPAQLIFKTIQSDNSITTQTGFIKFYDDHDDAANGGSMVIQSAGNMIIGSGESANACYTTDLVGNTNENMYITSDSNIYFYTNCQTYSSKKSAVYINTSGALYGAVWNDYAEYRQSEEPIEPGYIVYSGDDGILHKTIERLQFSEGVVSDTFGFSIGKTDKAQTPLAVAGRVLVYTDEELHAGDVVCAGKNGKASKMSDIEIANKPDRIVGIVSEIPTYDTWGEDDISINGRVWIRVK